MTLLEAIKSGFIPIRVTFGDRWIYYNEISKEWVVMEKQPDQL